MLFKPTSKTRERYLRGEKLASQIKAMVDNGLIVTLVLDCCFAGSVMRDDSSVRFLKYDPKVDVAYPSASEPDPKDELGHSHYRSASMRINWLVDPKGFTILTACGPTEIAKEIVFDKKRHGALSYLLLESLDKLGHVKCKQRYIYSHLRARYQEAQEQYPNEGITNPMFYENKNLGFFGSTRPGLDCAPIPVIQKRNGGLQLEAGQAHGVNRDDEFFLHLPSSAKLNFMPQAGGLAAKVTQARALMSDIEILGKRLISIEDGLMAISHTCLSLWKFRVRLELSLSQAEEWAKALKRRPSLDVYDNASAELARSYSFYIGKNNHNYYEIRDEFNQRIPESLALVDSREDGARHVLDMVEHLARFKLVRDLTNASLADPEHAFNKSFNVQLVNSAGQSFLSGCSQGGRFSTDCCHSECLIEAEDGEVLRLIVQNGGKREDPNLYAHVYNLGPCWEIDDILHGNHQVIPPREGIQHEDF